MNDYDNMKDFFKYKHHPTPYSKPYKIPSKPYEIDVNDVVKGIYAIDEKLHALIRLNQELVRAAETELVELKYDTGIKTLTTSVTSDPGPDDVSATGYTQEFVYSILERTSPELYIVNLGPGTIFVRMSKNGKSFSQAELLVFEGDVKVIYDVYEVRLRSPIAGTQYTISEFQSTIPAKTFAITTTSILSGWNLKRTGITYELQNSFDVNTTQTVPIPVDIADGLEVSKISLFFNNANAKDVRIDFNLGGFPAAVYERQYSVDANVAQSTVLVFGDQYRYNNMTDITIQTLNGTLPQTANVLATFKRQVD